MTTLWATEASLYVGIDNRGNIVTSVSSSPTLAKGSLYSAQMSRKLSQTMRYPDEKVTQG